MTGAKWGVAEWLDEATRQLLSVIDTLAKYDDDFVLRHDVRGKAGKARGAIELALRAYERERESAAELTHELELEGRWGESRARLAAAIEAEPADERYRHWSDLLEGGLIAHFGGGVER